MRRILGVVGHVGHVGELLARHQPQRLAAQRAERDRPFAGAAFRPCGDDRPVGCPGKDRSLGFAQPRSRLDLEVGQRVAPHVDVHRFPDGEGETRRLVVE